MPRSNASNFALPQGIPLAWKRGTLVREFGFRQQPASNERIPILYTDDAHSITFAPTGGGKGRRVLVPVLLTQQNPIIVFDPKGELFATTARYRREVLGHRIVLLDPLGVCGTTSDSFNPLDIFSIRTCSPACTAEEIARFLESGHVFRTDPYWNDNGTALASAWLAHYATTKPPEERTLPSLRREIYESDMVYRVALMMDQKLVSDEMARQEFTAFLEIPSDKTRPCVESTLKSYFKAIASQEISHVLGPSTFSLQDVVDGKPISVYIVLPPWLMDAQRTLLRLWIGTFLAAILSRPAIPVQRTLFLLDEASLLSHLPQLLTAVTLCRGYGLMVWTFWQDLSQLKTLYPTDWQTMVDNSAVIEAFGIANGLMAKELSEIMGVESADLLELEESQIALHLRGQGFVLADSLDYLRDPEFAGRFDPNPRYVHQHVLESESSSKGDGHELCR